MAVAGVAMVAARVAARVAAMAAAAVKMATVVVAMAKTAASVVVNGVRMRDSQEEERPKRRQEHRLWLRKRR